MLIEFLNKLYLKPQQYQLVWLYIMGHINDGKRVNLSQKLIKEKFNIPKSKFYRILNFGLMYFNTEVNGVSMVSINGFLTIEVLRGKPIKKVIKKTPKIVKPNDLSIEIIEYLNTKTNKRYSIKSDATIKLINSRINDGFTIDDFKKVIDVKVSKWINTTMEDYLRPQTLFSAKMEGYLNEKIIKTERNDKFTTTQSAVDNAKQVDWFPKE